MADISKIRALHDFKENFDLSDQVLKSYIAQLAEDDQGTVDRFFSGFEIEDWFEAIFGIMPWTRLLHSLSQRQIPTRSKTDFQVPDFSAFIETSKFKSEPLLIEVKRVSGMKRTLKLRKSQVLPTKEYADVLGIPLVYAIYWDFSRSWTLNTIDVFENKSSTYKLSIGAAVGFDCSLVFGDISFLVAKKLTRTQIFTSDLDESSSIAHDSYGALVSDQLIVEKTSHSLSTRETAALDAVIDFHETSKTADGPKTIIQSQTRDNSLFRLSGGITKYLSLFEIAPTELVANAAAQEIIQLMERICIERGMVYPTDCSAELAKLDGLFLHPES